MTNIVVLTGAGLSAESGLGTFRDVGGLWARYDISEVATPEGFARNPRLVHDFYNARRANCLQSAPNPAHHALARLSRSPGLSVALVTQNIDDLLERAGAEGVVHMHGEVRRMLCARCDRRWDAADVTDPDDPCPACGVAATRPDVVWFGEMPYQMAEIAELLERADLFVAIGTSGSVYPAAAFVTEAAASGARTLELNLEPSDVAAAFDDTRQGPASRLVPAFVDEILGDTAG